MDIPNNPNGLIFIYVPKDNMMVAAEYGTGDNLLQEDYDAGYNGYFNYYTYELSDVSISGETDGGMLMFNTGTDDYLRNNTSLAEALLREIYGEVPEYSIICAPSLGVLPNV